MERSIINSPSGNPLLQGIKNFLGKLRQSPDIYPIKYYKKSKRFRRHWQAPLVK
jgi:hypothetical protein